MLKFASIMTIPELIQRKGSKGFSIEVLPPLKGKGIDQLFAGIDSLKCFEPRYINITTHRSEMVYKSTADGLYQRVSERRVRALWLWPPPSSNATAFRPFRT